MKTLETIILVLGISHSFAALFNLYSADNRFAGQVEAETDAELVSKAQKSAPRLSNAAESWRIP